MKNLYKFVVTLFVVVAALGLVSSAGANSSSAAPSAQQSIVEPRPIQLEAAEGDLPLVVPPPAEFLMRRPRSATINVNFLVAGQKMWPGASYEVTCETWPTDAQTAVNYAKGIWESLINSTVPIVLDACWGNTGSPTNLGRGGPTPSWRDFSGAPQAGTWYAPALANTLHGSDLNGATAELQNAFNSSRSDWYFGTGGTTPSGKFNFVSVVLHEIGHALGFLGGMAYGIAEGCGGANYGCRDAYPYIYDRFTENGAGTDLISYANPSIALGTQLTSNDIYFNGANANAANGGSRPKLYAPATWTSGSSYAHLDETTFNGTGSALMTPYLNPAETNHNPGPVTMGIMKDMGWTLSSGGVSKVYLPLALMVTGTWTTIVSENFEGTFPGVWNVFDNNGASYGTYFWGKRTCRPYAGSYSGWGVGGGANGSALGCGSNYPNYADSWMMYGPFSLAGATASDLSYKVWTYTEPIISDSVCAMASINGANFYGYCTYGNTSGWLSQTLNLASVPTLGNLLGQANVWIALIFRSDYSVNYAEGGYVDDIVLRKCTGGICSASSPPALPSGGQFMVVPAQTTISK